MTARDARTGAGRHPMLESVANLSHETRLANCGGALDQDTPLVTQETENCFSIARETLR